MNELIRKAYTTEIQNAFKKLKNTPSEVSYLKGYIDGLKKNLLQLNGKSVELSTIIQQNIADDTRQHSKGLLAGYIFDLRHLEKENNGNYYDNPEE